MFVSRCGMAGIESSAHLVTVCVYVWYVDNFILVSVSKMYVLKCDFLFYL